MLEVVNWTLMVKACGCKPILTCTVQGFLLCEFDLYSLFLFDPVAWDQAELLWSNLTVGYLARDI